MVLTWCFEDETNEKAEACLDALGAGTEAVVPAIWPSEVGNGLIVAERRGRMKPAQAMAFIHTLGRLPITVQTPTLADTDLHMTIAREHGLSVYDASYVHLAAQLGVRLGTCDAQLEAAAARIGVPLV